MRPRPTHLISAIALAAGLAACGDGGPSKSEFTTKADASCAAGNSAISAVAKPSNAPQVATAAGTATSTIDGQVSALRAMKTPGGDDKKRVDGIVAAIAEVSAPTKALQEAAGKTDDAGMAKAAGEMQAKADAAATEAQAYGLAQCGTALKPAVANLFEGTKGVVKSGFVSKANSLCRDAGRKAGAVARPSTPTMAAAARYFDAILPVASKLVGDFKTIPVPPGDETLVSEMIASLDTVNAKIKDMSAAAKANNPRLLGGLTEELGVADTASNAKLDAYGLKACGSVGDF